MTYLTDRAALDALPERERYPWRRSKPFEWTDQEAVEAAMRTLLAGGLGKQPDRAAFETIEREIGYLDFARRRVARDILAKAAQGLLARAIVSVVTTDPLPGALCDATGFGTCGSPMRKTFKAKVAIAGRPYCQRDGDKARDKAVNQMLEELTGRRNVVGLDDEPDALQAYVEAVARALATDPYASAELSAELIAKIDDYGSKWGALVEAVPA